MKTIKLEYWTKVPNERCWQLSRVYRVGTRGKARKLARQLLGNCQITKYQRKPMMPYCRVMPRNPKAKPEVIDQEIIYVLSVGELGWTP